MKNDKIIDAVGSIDGDLVENYFKTEAKLQSAKRRPMWVKVLAVAACVALIATAVAAVIPLFERDDPTFVDGIERPYKDLNILGPELGIVWTWDQLTVYEQFRSMELDGVQYSGYAKEIDGSLVGEKLGNYTAIGYDNVEGKEYSKPLDVYEIQNVSVSRLVAAKMEGKYYVFARDGLKTPATLGDMLDEYGLTETLTLSRFSKEKRTIGYLTPSEYFALNDDAYIWEVLSSCRSAKAADTVGWHETNNDYISFTVTTEALGAYKKVLYVTAHGYVYTNFADYAYLYYIGEDAASKIIAYAMENSEDAELEPYKKTITGTITEITDDYILIDDSLLCKDPADGITFKVLLNDLRIARYVDSGIVKVGDTAQITYEGGIDLDGYVIDSAVAAAEAIISGDHVLIPE